MNTDETQALNNDEDLIVGSITPASLFDAFGTYLQNRTSIDSEFIVPIDEDRFMHCTIVRRATQ